MATKKIQPKRDGTRVVIPCRLSYVHLDAPWSNREGNEKKYSVSCIISKDDKESVEVINAAIKAAKEQGKVSKWQGKIPSGVKTVVHDGDAERADDEAYSNAIFFNANSKNAVPTLNRLKENIPPTDIYSGCYGLVSVNFFPYAGSGAGVGAGLNAVLKLEDGEKLGNAGNAANDFNGMDFGADDELDDL